MNIKEQADIILRKVLRAKGHKALMVYAERNFKVLLTAPVDGPRAHYIQQTEAGRIVGTYNAALNANRLEEDIAHFLDTTVVARRVR